MAFKKLNLDPKVFQQVYQTVLTEQSKLLEETEPSDIENLQGLYEAMIKMKMHLEQLQDSENDKISEEAEDIYHSVFEYFKRINRFRAKYDQKHQQRIRSK